jgi:hypothetical protein
VSISTKFKTKEFSNVIQALMNHEMNIWDAQDLAEDRDDRRNDDPRHYDLSLWKGKKLVIGNYSVKIKFFMTRVLSIKISHGPCLVSCKMWSPNVPGKCNICQLIIYSGAYRSVSDKPNLLNVYFNGGSVKLFKNEKDSKTRKDINILVQFPLYFTKMVWSFKLFRYLDFYSTSPKKFWSETVLGIMSDKLTNQKDWLIKYQDIARNYKKDKNRFGVPKKVEKDYITFHSTFKKTRKRKIALLTWQDAEMFCHQHGGHLLSLHSQKELDIILTLIASYYFEPFAVYIGLKYRVSIHCLHWSEIFI